MVAGNNQRLIVCLLPGLDGTGRLYRRLAAELSGDFEVRILDYPADEFDGYEGLSENLALRLPQSDPFLIVAESFAGPLAVLLAASRPPGLEGVVIAASFLRSPVAQAGFLSRILRFLPTSIPPPLPILEAVLMGRWKDIEMRRELEESLRLVKPDVLKARLMAALRVDVREEFHRIAAPVLYLRATRDRLLQKNVVKGFAMKEGHVQRTDIEAPHFLFQAAASQAAEAMRNFLRDHAIWK
ncbi:MAG: alpha/beta fold hydrolase, partial [Bradyrhizobium sp.]